MSPRTPARRQIRRRPPRGAGAPPRPADLGLGPRPAPPPAGAGPVATATAIRFAVPDRERRWASVRLYSEAHRPRDVAAFAWDAGAWVLELARPPVDRLEYALIVRHHDGGEELRTDPTNPRTAPGPFGDKSELRLPGYVPPAWLDADPPLGRRVEAAAPSRTLAADVPLEVWEPAAADPDAPLPLVVALDGPEYDRFAALTRCLAAAIAEERIPPLRAALVAPVPGRRDDDYSASERFARALVRDVLPFAAWLAPTAGAPVVAMGASLGGLAALHAARRYPGAFDGLLLQSGSFFAPETDADERWFPHFRRIATFVRSIRGGAVAGPPIPIRMTCGAVEPNLVNNRAVAEALRRQGHDVDLAIVRDAHTYRGWRDAFDPHLLDLLSLVAG